MSNLKVKSIILYAAIVFLCQCKKESGTPYSNENIVRDNAQGALYFHAIFRETESVWAYIDSMDYAGGVYKDPADASTMYRELKCNKGEKLDTVFVAYNGWKTGNLSLAGKMKVVFSNDSSYRKTGMVANIYLLDDFSINGQSVAGESSIKFTGNSEKDLYTFTLLNGSTIYELGRSKPALISGTISNGQYERVEGRETFEPDDDVWTFYGVMTGQLHNDPGLKYTYTVSATYTEDGASKNGKVFYNSICTTAQKGRSIIKIQGRPEILFEYLCSDYFFVSVTHVD